MHYLVERPVENSRPTGYKIHLLALSHKTAVSLPCPSSLQHNFHCHDTCGTRIMKHSSHESFSGTLAECPTVELNPVTSYLETQQTLQGEDSAPQDGSCPVSHHLPIQVIICLQSVDQKSKVPMILCFGLINFLECFTELRKHDSEGP